MITSELTGNGWSKITHASLVRDSGKTRQEQTLHDQASKLPQSLYHTFISTKENSSQSYFSWDCSIVWPSTRSIAALSGAMTFGPTTNFSEWWRVSFPTCQSLDWRPPPRPEWQKIAKRCSAWRAVWFSKLLSTDQIFSTKSDSNQRPKTSVVTKLPPSWQPSSRTSLESFTPYPSRM